jgi:hypothetical protein
MTENVLFYLKMVEAHWDRMKLLYYPENYKTRKRVVYKNVSQKISK